MMNDPTKSHWETSLEPGLLHLTATSKPSTGAKSHGERPVSLSYAKFTGLRYGDHDTSASFQLPCQRNVVETGEIDIIHKTSRMVLRALLAQTRPYHRASSTL